MKTYEGNVEITKENHKEWAEKLKGVEKISGYLSINANAELKALTSVGGDLYINANAELKALTSVGGDLTINANAELKAPDMKHNLGPSVRTRIVESVRESFRKNGYLWIDGILSKLVSKRKQGQVVVYKTKRIGSDKVQYVVQRGETYSHGETVKQASHDLRYKLTDRDTTKYAKWTLESVHPIADMIGAYRVITGSCEAGTKQWCEGKKLPAKLSVRLAIRATRGAYRSDMFKAFFEKK